MIAGKVMIVTGASSGIGHSLARLAHEEGAEVVLAARRKERIDALAADLGGALAVQTDVTDPAQLENLVDRTVDRHGRIDVLVNNAGIGLAAPVTEMSLTSLRRVFDVNVIGPTVAMRLVVPIMRRQGAGTIVNVSSGTTRIPSTMPGYAAYVGAKAAINKISETARNELEGEGIVVSLVLPFITETEFHQAQIKEGATSHGPPPGAQSHSAEYVARQILALIESGDPELALMPASVR